MRNKLKAHKVYADLNEDELAQKEIEAIGRFYNNLLPSDLGKFDKNKVEEYVARLIFAIDSTIDSDLFYVSEFDNKITVFCDTPMFEIEPSTVSITDLAYDRNVTLEDRKVTLSSFMMVHNILAHRGDKNMQFECYFVNSARVPELKDFGVKYDKNNLLFRLGEFQNRNGTVKAELLNNLVHNQMVLDKTVGLLHDGLGSVSDTIEMLKSLISDNRKQTSELLNYLEFYIEDKVVLPLVKVAHGE